jgi:hypothetical protein
VTQPKPTITGTTHTLPFHQLSPHHFERLCLWLVEREGFDRTEHLGAAGSEQGRDTIARAEGLALYWRMRNRFASSLARAGSDCSIYERSALTGRITAQCRAIVRAIPISVRHH